MRGYPERPGISLAFYVLRLYLSIYPALWGRRISSVGRAFDCRVEGRGFDSWGWTISQGLKIP